MRLASVLFFAALTAGCTSGPVPGDFNFDQQIDQEQDDNQINSTDVKMCVTANAIYVMWIDDRKNFQDVWFNTSTDGGQTWLSSPVQVKTGAGNASGLSIACTGDHVYAAWEDTRDSDSAYSNIYVNYSSNGGRKWQKEDKRLDLDPEGRYISLAPQIAIFQGSVHVVWFDQIDGAPSIYMASSANAGRNFDEPVRVSGDPESPGAFWSGNPRIAMDGKGRVHIVWEDTRNGTQDIFYSRSNEAGTNFTEQTRLSKGAKPGKSYSFAPSISTDDDSVYVAWHDTRGGDKYDIYMNYSGNGGNAWLGEATRVEKDAPGSAESRDVNVKVVGDTAHLVWQDNGGGAGGYDILYQTATGGVVADAPETRLDAGDARGVGNSLHPKLAIDDGTVVAVWEELRAGIAPGLNDLMYNFTEADPVTAWSTTQDLRLSTAPAGTSFTKDLNVAVQDGSVYVAWRDFRDGEDDGDVYFAAVPVGDPISTAEDAKAAGLIK